MKQFRKWMQYAGLVIGGAIMLYQINSAVSTLYDKHISYISLSMLLLAFIPVTLSIGVQMMGWSAGMKSLGVYLSVPSVIQGYLLSFLPRYIPGTIWGYISRSEWLYQDYGVDYKVSYQGSIVETIAAIAANIIVLILPFLRDNLQLQSVLVLLPFIIWGLFRLINRASSQKLTKSWSFIRVLFPDVRLKYWLISVSLFLLVWLLYGIGLMLVVGSFTEQVGAFNMKNMITLTSVYAGAWLVGFFVLFAPTGLGFRELALTNLLAMQLGVSFGYGSVLAVLFRVVILLSELVWLVVSLMLKKGLARQLAKQK